MKVRDVMTKDVATVPMDATLQDVVHLLADARSGVVVVIDEKGTPAGMVSDTELFLRERKFGFTLKLHSLFGELVDLDNLPHHYQSARHLTARDVMTAWVPHIEAESDLRRLVLVMTENRLSRVVVVERNKVIGIVTRADLVSQMLKGEIARPQKASPRGEEQGHRNETAPDEMR